MKTIGRLIKEARIKKKYSLKKIEAATKIKGGFISSIEKENWSSLPDFTVVSGFVKNIASFLKMDEATALAVLRRDYPPRPVSINPKPDIGREFIWGPRLTFLAGILAAAILILGYLGFQYLRFISPPALAVYEPKEGQVVSQRELEVSGKTDMDATIKVNNQPTIVDQDGNFTATIEVSEKTNEIDVVAKSRSGKETIVKRKIILKL